jgi:hypothetical protein
MEGGSGLPAEDPELTRTKVAWLWEAGAHVMGRVTYSDSPAASRASSLSVKASNRVARPLRRVHR